MYPFLMDHKQGELGNGLILLSCLSNLASGVTKLYAA